MTLYMQHWIGQTFTAYSMAMFTHSTLCLMESNFLDVALTRNAAFWPENTDFKCWKYFYFMEKHIAIPSLFVS